MVSIGANNSPLAAACTDVSQLQQHYYDIVENLNLNVLDFDIEGTGLPTMTPLTAVTKLLRPRRISGKRKVVAWGSGTHCLFCRLV